MGNGMRAGTVLIVTMAVVMVAGPGGLHRDAVDSVVAAESMVRSSDREEKDRILRLQKDLQGLAGTVDERDALLVADTVIRTSKVLAEQYELVSPPLWHNFLVNQGVKKRGLCWHWTTDLLKQLRKLDQNSFDFHWGIAHAETPWRIHNTVVATGKGQAFDEGMVLDPWRDSGRLFWARVKADRYPWKFRPYP